MVELEDWWMMLRTTVVKYWRLKRKSPWMQVLRYRIVEVRLFFFLIADYYNYLASTRTFDFIFGVIAYIFPTSYTTQK